MVWEKFYCVKAGRGPHNLLSTASFGPPVDTRTRPQNWEFRADGSDASDAECAVSRGVQSESSVGIARSTLAPKSALGAQRDNVDIPRVGTPTVAPDWRAFLCARAIRSAVTAPSLFWLLAPITFCRRARILNFFGNQKIIKVFALTVTGEKRSRSKAGSVGDWR